MRKRTTKQMLAGILALVMLFSLLPTAAFAAAAGDSPTDGTAASGPSSPYLNLEDHYAYIVGYEDGLVHPEKNITRAEVATIFFRMLTDEARSAYWSTENSFSDVTSGDWYNSAVSTLANLGVIGGYPDGTFLPNGNITRAEFAAIAVRFFENTGDYTWDADAFSDIAGHWANESINLAYLLGIVGGYPDGTFGPGRAITRAEAITVVNNTLRRTPSAEGIEPVREDMITWPDNLDATQWYYAAVQEATNSHGYTYVTGADGELWTEKLSERDWTALEQEWADANASAGPDTPAEPDEGEQAGDDTAPEQQPGEGTGTTPDPQPGGSAGNSGSTGNTGNTGDAGNTGGETVLQDRETGAEVSFGTAAVTRMTVEPVSTVAALEGKPYVAYDITPYNSDSTKYTGSATVTIPLSEELKACELLCGGVVEADGSITYIAGTRVGDNYTFTTPHFSTVTIVGNTAPLNVGDTATATIPGSYTKSNVTIGDENVVSVSLSQTDRELGDKISLTTAITTAQTGLITDGTNYLKSDGTLTTNISDAGVWTVTKSNNSSSYLYCTIKNESDQYLYYSTSGNQGTQGGNAPSLSVSTSSATWYINASTGFFAYSNPTKYYLYASNGAWALNSDSSANTYLYDYTEATTTLTITAEAAGETTVTVGGTTYTITVSASGSSSGGGSDSGSDLNVNLVVGGESATRTISGVYSGTLLDNSYAKVTAAVTTDRVMTTSNTSLPTSSNETKTVLISDNNGNYLALDGSNPVVVTDINKATVWTVAYAGNDGNNYYTISSGNTYLSYNYTSNNGTNTYTGSCELTTKTSSANWYCGGETGFCAYPASYYYYYPYVDKGTWKMKESTETGLGYINSYSFTEATSTLTFTGVAEGTTSVTVGGTTYNITVTDAGNVVPITLKAGATVTVVDTSGNYQTETGYTTADPTRATVTVTGAAANADTKQVVLVPSAVSGYAMLEESTVSSDTSLYYKIGSYDATNYQLQYYIKIGDGGTLTMTKDPDEATQCYVQGVPGNAGEYYLEAYDSNSVLYFLCNVDGELKAMSRDAYTEYAADAPDAEYYNSGIIWLHYYDEAYGSYGFYMVCYNTDGAKVYVYPYYSETDSEWKVDGDGTWSDPCIVTTAASGSNGATAVSITGVTAGETSVMVGDTTYRITVEPTYTVPVTVYKGYSKTYTDFGGAYPVTDLKGTNEEGTTTIATVSSETKVSDVVPVTSIQNGDQFVIYDGYGHYLSVMRDLDGTVKGVAYSDNFELATEWTAVATEWENVYELVCTETVNGVEKKYCLLRDANAEAVRLQEWTEGTYADYSWYYDSGVLDTFDAESYYTLYFDTSNLRWTFVNAEVFVYNTAQSFVEAPVTKTEGAQAVLPTTSGDSVTGVIKYSQSYLMLPTTAGGAISITGDINQATEWTVTCVSSDSNGPYYTISSGVAHLGYSTDNSGVPTALTASQTAGHTWYCDGNGFYAVGSDSTKYYLSADSSGAWIFNSDSSISAYSSLYTFTETAEGERGAEYTVVTISGDEIGTTSVVVGNVRYDIEVINPESVVYFPVTLFDYDLTAFNNAVSAADNGNGNGIYFVDGSIDKNTAYAYYNWWTGSLEGANGNRTYSGMAQDTLDANGNILFNYPDAGLFTADTFDGKTIYNNVELPFRYNAATGVYTFDASKYGAYFHTDEEQGTSNTPASNSKLYYSETPQGHNFTGQDGSSKGWFPFDDTTSVYTNTADYYFGMQASVSFSMTSDGYVIQGDSSSDPIRFHFSGDDDVWVFIDGQLVLDLGGCRNGMDATINFATNEWSITAMNPDVGVAGDVNGASMSGKIFNDDEGKGKINQTQETFAATITHELTIFYLERGGGSSNCEITFNLPIYDSLSVTKKVEKPETMSDETWAGLSDMIANLSFNFTVYKGIDYVSGVGNDGETVETKTVGVPLANTTFTLLDVNGTVIDTQSTDVNGRFILKDGQTAKFIGNINELIGTYYYVEEDTPAGFEKTEFTCTTNTAKKATVNETGAPKVAGRIASPLVYVVGTNRVEDSISFLCTNTLNNQELSVETYQDWIVLDYGLPVVITPTRNDLWIGDTIELLAVGKAVTEPDAEGRAQIVGLWDASTNEEIIRGTDSETIGKLAPQDEVSHTTDYGTVKLNKTKEGDAYPSVLYTPTKCLDGVDILGYLVKVTTDTTKGLQSQYAFGLIYIIPATSVYYEENFGNTAEDGEPFNGMVKYAAASGAAWTVEGTPETDYQENGYVAATNTYPYGSDLAYLNDSGDSNGTSMYVDTTGGAAGFYYTFTGTGTSFFARTSADSGYLKVEIIKGEWPTSADTDTEVIAAYAVNTKYAAAETTLYNIPVFTYNAVERGTYTVRVTIYQKSTVCGNDFYLDGIRVLNPLFDPASPPTDEGTLQIAQTSYVADGEAYMTVATLRDKLLSYTVVNEDGTLSWKDTSFIVFTDSNGEITTAEEFKNIGPKEEVYLNNGQSVTFSLDGWDNTNKIYLGIKAPTGSGTVTINGTKLDIGHTTDCYYDISGYANGSATFTITAGSDCLISITNIKVTGNKQFAIIKN